DGAVTQSVLVRWHKDLPPKRDECWFLMTDQPGTAHQLCQLYGRRMTIEQLFRDDKSKRNGWSLRDTKITRPDRLDRLLLIMALAYILLCGIGLLALKIGKPRDWSSASKNDCSVLVIGRVMLAKLNVTVAHAWRAVAQA